MGDDCYFSKTGERCYAAEAAIPRCQNSLYAAAAREKSGLGEILLEIVVEGLTIGGFGLCLLF